MNGFKNSWAWRSLKSDLDVDYSYDRHEYKYSIESGHNIHSHTTLGCMNRDISSESIKERIMPEWKKQAIKQGLRNPSHRGTHVTDSWRGWHSDDLPEKQEIKDTSLDFPDSQVSFTLGDIEKIFFNYKRNDEYSNPKMECETARNILVDYRSSFKGKKYTRVYFK